jgi:hypothetical protein
MKRLEQKKLPKSQYLTREEKSALQSSVHTHNDPHVADELNGMKTDNLFNKDEEEGRDIEPLNV